jgi:hypothetical protein
MIGRRRGLLTPEIISDQATSIIAEPAEAGATPRPLGGQDRASQDCGETVAPLALAEPEKLAAPASRCTGPTAGDAGRDSRGAS